MGKVLRQFELRVAVATAFGLCVGLGLWSPCCAGILAPQSSCISLAGALFAVSVFVPYVTRGRFFWLRSTGLAVIGAFGYQCAWRAGWGAFDAWHVANPLALLFIGCIVGTAIILTGARMLVPLRHAFRLAIAGSVASIVGSLILSLNQMVGWVVWGLWHAVMATAIYVAQNRALRSGGAK
jgi:hypothetical protein